MYLLDTNACIRVLNGTSRAFVARLEREPATNVALCSVVKAELNYGARRSSRVAENVRILRRFFAPFTSFAFDDAAADQYGLIRADLASAGAPIGPNDLSIAAIARARDLVLVTHNTREFGRVVGLQLEDWE